MHGLQVPDNNFTILYINDIFDLLRVAKPFNFVDDTKFLMAVHIPEDHILQHDVYKLTTWNNSWHLLLNSSKCFHLHYHFSNTQYPH